MTDLIDRARAVARAQFDASHGTDSVLVNLLIAGFCAFLVIGIFEALTLGEWGGWVQPVSTVALIGWAVVMKRNDAPRPVPLLITSSTLATLFLVGSALLGSTADVTNSSPIVMVVGAGAIAMAAGGRRPLRVALYTAAMCTISVVAVQVTVDPRPAGVFAELGSSLVVIGTAYFLILFVRGAYETGSTRYAGLLETAPVAVIEADLSSLYRQNQPRWPTVRDLNPRAREVLGVFGQEATTIRPRQIPEPFQELAVEIVKSKAMSGERVVALDGDRAMLVGWRSLNRTLNRVIFTAVDVTSQRRAERALEEQVKARDRFIATVSHELRTPLTGMLGLLEVLASGDMDPDERHELMNMALGQGRDMADIIQDLLVAARASNGGLTIKPEDVELHKVVDSVLGSVHEHFDVVPAATPVVTADPVRVRQIVRNLVTNAVRYGGAQRKILIETTGDRAAIEVRDTGEPLSAEFTARMFEPYERLTGSELPTESVGLGLTVARMLARLMDGDLTYRRARGLTVFELVLPLNPEHGPG